MKRRGSGILLHITSLPSFYGIGDMGPWAYRFVDFLAETKQRFWQILPLNPTDPAYGNSPYQSNSAFACSNLLISPDFLVQEGFLEKVDLQHPPDFPMAQVDYGGVIEYKKALFQQAYERFKNHRNDEYEHFCMENSYWLDDFALFNALKSHFYGQVWSEWPQEMRDRWPDVLQTAKNDFSDKIELEKFLQYIFHKQWGNLKSYCYQKNVQIIGDLPIYVQHDSVDLWTHPELFKLDNAKNPCAVAGVPPDYFSATGQLWGNPVYRWDVLKENGYEWWVQRIRENLELYDFLRLDHFRGFVSYWELPATEKTAINGEWIEAPAEDFFNVILKKIPSADIIAEDLGIITPDVKEIMHRFNFPGMKLLLFAFGDDIFTNPYIPHNLVKNCVAYTGTHDNNTARGWFEKEATPQERRRLFQYLGREVTSEDLHWELIRLVMMSVANLAIFPMQDILGLGEESRMNRPATKKGNWQWRLIPDSLTPDVKEKLRSMTEIYGRV